MKAKKWNICVLVSVIILLFLFAVPTVYWDPLFHYHAPRGEYYLDNERYQNAGIIKHFSYNALIIGTSMTENFKTSEMDDIFGVKSVKVPFPGARFKEINDNVKLAIEHNPELKLVLRGLDTSGLNYEKDAVFTANTPEYLYDNNIWNDVNYIWNKSIFFNETIKMYLLNQYGGTSTTFDEYAYWGNKVTYGKEAVLASYQRSNKVAVLANYQRSDKVKFTEKDYERVLANIRQNVTSVAKENPEITFCYFLTPYSIVWWDIIKRNGILEYMIEVQKVAIEEMLRYDNIQLYSWIDNEKIVCDLNNYKDFSHYSADINSDMLKWIKKGTGKITSDNYMQYLEKIYKFYDNYDYDSLFQ